MLLSRFALMFGLTGLTLVPAAFPLLAQRPVTVWLTTPDKKHLLEKQEPVAWQDGPAKNDAIVIDEARVYQTINGFGHTLTGGSAQLLMRMSQPARRKLLEELFGQGEEDISINYLRVTVGASDMNDFVYTYDDIPSGKPDPKLIHFTLAEDDRAVIPILREILSIQPGIKILASPWTAPFWMKDSRAAKGGTLMRQYYGVYARYLVLYLQAMRARGITVDALTPQNEPENPNNTPSMTLTAKQEAEFIGQFLGPAITGAGLKTKIIAFDHNCDHPEYPETVLRDPEAAQYTDGSGFHLYRGNMNSLTEIHDMFPAKNVYFTEQMTVAPKGTMPLAGPVAKLIIGAPANWSRNVLLWNLAADADNGPHTLDGGCPMCSGALTIVGDHATRLVAYYAVAHASKFVPSGSVRIDSGSEAAVLPHVAFRTPAGQLVLIVANLSMVPKEFAIAFHGKIAHFQLGSGAVATCVW
jgi:glucosylceramidase